MLNCTKAMNIISGSYDLEYLFIRVMDIHSANTYISRNGRWLTHWGRDKMDAISQTTYSRAFPSMKVVVFWLNFHWNMFERVVPTHICGTRPQWVKDVYIRETSTSGNVPLVCADKKVTYRQTSNINSTKSQYLNASLLELMLTLSIEARCYV